MTIGDIQVGREDNPPRGISVPESECHRMMPMTTDDVRDIEDRLIPHGGALATAETTVREVKRQEMFAMFRRLAERPVRSAGVRTAPRPTACSRSRERRPSARRASRSGSRGDPDPSPGDDPPGGWPLPAGRGARSGDTDLNIVWAEARGRFETDAEYRTLARLSVIKARQLRGWS